MKKFLVITMLVLAAAAFTLTPTISEATCEGYGYIIRVSTLPGSSLTYIYFRTSSLSNVYYYATSTDSKIIGAAHNAVTSRVRVLIKGNASSCPASGSIGTATYLALSP